MDLIRALQKDEEFLDDVRQQETDSPYVHIWWLGQSGYLVSYGGTHILIDPYLSDSLTKKYEHTFKPHTRMSERVVDPSRLDFIDIVSSSHNHTDHLDGETLIPLIQANPNIKMVIPEANRAFVCERIHMPLSFPVGLNDGAIFEDQGVRYEGVPAAHNLLERDEKGNCRYMGYVITIGGKKIYHSGDTLLYEGMVERLKPLQIDLAILPINGNLPSRNVAGNLNCEEAVYLASAIGAKLTIPCHYDMFSFNTADPRDFAAIASARGLNYQVLQHGQRLSLH